MQTWPSNMFKLVPPAGALIHSAQTEYWTMLDRLFSRHPYGHVNATCGLTRHK